MKTLTAIIVLCLLTGVGAQAQQAPHFDGNSWWNYVKVLADDNMEGRETGSAATSARSCSCACANPAASGAPASTPCRGETSSAATAVRVSRRACDRAEDAAGFGPGARNERASGRKLRDGWQ